MSKSSTRLLAIAAVGGLAYYFLFRKKPDADPLIIVQIPGQAGQGQIRLSAACAAAKQLYLNQSPDWVFWANVCRNNGGSYS